MMRNKLLKVSCFSSNGNLKNKTHFLPQDSSIKCTYNLINGISIFIFLSQKIKQKNMRGVKEGRR